MESGRVEDLDLEALSVRDLLAALSQVEDQRRRARGEATSGRPGGSSSAEAGSAALAGREERILRELRRRARARQRAQRRGRDLHR